MARRRRGSSTRTTRQTRKTKKVEKVNGIVSSKDEDSNCAMDTDSTNGMGESLGGIGADSAEELTSKEPVVHHKKFGKIRMSGQNENSQDAELQLIDTSKDCSRTDSKSSDENESESTENNFTSDAGVLDIMRGIEISGPKGRSSYNEYRKQSSVYNAENDIPLDGSVIIKPGTFSSNTISSSVKSNTYYNTTSNTELSSVNFLKVLQGIEMLERNVSGSIDFDRSSPKPSEDFVLNMESPKPSYVNDDNTHSNCEKLEPDIKTEEENCVDEFKPDLSVRPMDISSPEDTSSDLQNETEEATRKLDSIALGEKLETSESSASKNSDDVLDKKLPGARSRTGSSDTACSESSSNGGTSVRRSNRIRSIGIMKQKEKEQTAVKSELVIKSPLPPDSPAVTPPVPGFEEKPVKVKSRWRRSSELEMHGGRIVDPEGTSSNCSSPVNCMPQPPPSVNLEPTAEELERLEQERKEIEEGLKSFTILTENEYKTERSACKETKRMICDCVLTKEEISRGEVGCGEDCLNRMLFLECGPRCALGERCTNKRFQKLEYANCKIFKTEKKGYGLRAEEDLPGNTFIMEYVGEVVNQKEFARRVKMYAKENNKHFYFMALKGDAVIDATNKGNISRFINHSCDPNAETQKWTINGELRVGFFTRRFIPAGEEITFDYQFQRYGKQAQKCFCEAPTCRGWIGENPEDTDEDEGEEEDEDDEDEDEEDEEEEEEEEEEEKKEEEQASEEEGTKEIKKLTKSEDDKEKKEAKVSKPAVRKVKKEKKKNLEKKKATTIVDDMGLDEEIQKLFQTGLKNRAHTLTLSRLMVRAEDWSTRGKLLQLIREGETPCRRLFLDYHGLRLICSWMVSRELEESNDKNERRLEILKTLETLPIPNKNMLIDSKVLNVVEQWSKTGCVSRKLSVDEELGTEENKKPKAEETLPGLGGEILTATENKEETVKEESEEKDLESLKNVKRMAESVLKSWSSLKEVFKIPKKERIEQMKEHERQADRGYSEYLDNKENFRDKYDRHDRYGRSDRYRNERDRDRIRDRKRMRESPPDPEWFRNHERNSKLTKQERRQLFALKVLQEDEEAKKRNEHLEMWKQHESRCLALGLDPNLNAACDPQTGFPIFFDHNSGTWQNCPPSSGPSPSMSHSTTPSMCPSPMYPIGPPVMHNNCHMCPPMPMCSPMNNPICQHVPGQNGLMHPNPMPMPNGPVPMTPHQGQPFPPNMTPQYQGSVPPPGFENMPPPFMEPIQSENTSVPYEEAASNELIRPVITEVPLNAPIKLPPKWKSAKDSKGRVYYYHIKERVSQWEPPQWTEEDAKIEAAKTVALEMGEDSSSSTESSSESSSEDEDEAENGDASGNSKQTENAPNAESSAETAENVETKENEEETKVESPSNQFEDEKDEDLSAWEDEEEVVKTPKTSSSSAPAEVAPTPVKSIPSKPAVKVRRAGLVQEIIISPRREEDRIDNRKFKEVKEMLRRQKEEARAKLRGKGKEGGVRMSRTKKKRKEKVNHGNRLKLDKLSAIGSDSVTDKRIKENFKNSMAGAIVSHLNPYRKKDCKVGRITCNEDFKHLARKLTHFVMLKELKHCKGVDDLECNDSVKAKAKDFIKKYMAKFGAVYQRPQHEVWKT